MYYDFCQRFNLITWIPYLMIFCFLIYDTKIKANWPRFEFGVHHPSEQPLSFDCQTHSSCHLSGSWISWYHLRLRWGAVESCSPSCYSPEWRAACSRGSWVHRALIWRQIVMLVLEIAKNFILLEYAEFFIFVIIIL